MNTEYIIISPVRNEAANIEHTIKSVLSQTARPKRWVIVDDGSTDGTIEIVRRYLPGNDFMEHLTLEDRGFYDLMTGGEIKAFYRGYYLIEDQECDFIVKLDGDISFDEKYFEELLECFYQNPKLGIASGICCYETSDGLVKEYAHPKHVRGAARMYRRSCWNDIGGPIQDLGWDAIDVYKARMFGWETGSFDQLRMIHHVKTWTKGGALHGRARSGRMEFLMGSHPVFFASKVLREIFRKPYIISSIALTWGYVKSFFKKEPRVVALELMRFIRHEQSARIKGVFGKLVRVPGKEKKQEDQ